MLTYMVVYSTKYDTVDVLYVLLYHVWKCHVTKSSLKYVTNRGVGVPSKYHGGNKTSVASVGKQNRCWGDRWGGAYKMIPARPN